MSIRDTRYFPGQISNLNTALYIYRYISPMNIQFNYPMLTREPFLLYYIATEYQLKLHLCSGPISKALAGLELHERSVIHYLAENLDRCLKE